MNILLSIDIDGNDLTGVSKLIEKAMRMTPEQLQKLVTTAMKLVEEMDNNGR